MSQDFEQTNSDTPLGGRYKIISELGAGGFGQTFLAEDLHLPGHPRCVVKKLKPQTKDSGNLSMARRLFDTEAQVLYQLGNHDQIPRLLAHFEDNEEFYLVQELIEGKPLNHELVKGQPWTEVQVVALLQDVLQVLAFVHQQNVIHRDLKPPNLIRRHKDSRIVLIDFGAVKQVSTHALKPEAEQTNLTISIGTKGYMPNEQVAGNPRFSSDVYAVGMLAIQALTGVHPKRIKENPRTSEIDWRDRVQQISPELADIIDQMVRYDFRERYPTAVEALEALQSLPAALLELVPSPQASEPTGATASQEVPLPTLIREPTKSTLMESESEIELPDTNVWMPAQPPVTGGTASGAEATAPLSQQETNPNLSERSVSASTAPRSSRERIVRLWPVLAILAALGGILAIARTFPSPQPQTINRSSTLAPSPTPKPAATPQPSPTPKPQPTELLSQADELRKAGQNEKAISLYKQAIASKPKLAKAQLAKANWGLCYSLNKLQKPAEAIVACNDALAINPDYAETLLSKGNALDQQKQDLDALELYEQATDIKPNFAEAWISRGLALQKFGRSEEALAALEKGIALNRDSAKAWTIQGEALLNLGRIQPAIESLNKAIELQPNNAEAKKTLEKAKKQLEPQNN